MQHLGIGHTYVDEIGEEAGRHGHGRPDEGQPNQPPQPRRRLRHKNARRLVQVLHREEALLQIPLLQADPGAADHQLLHLLRRLRGHAVGHEAAVADPRHAGPAHAEGVHEAGDAASLERDGAVGEGREGGAEEEEIGDVDVEAGSEEGPEQVAPLPGRVGAEAVEENHGGPRRVGLRRHPAMQGRAVAEIGGGRLQASGREGAPVGPVAELGEAEPDARHGRESR